MRYSVSINPAAPPDLVINVPEPPDPTQTPPSTPSPPSTPPPRAHPKHKRDAAVIAADKERKKAAYDDAINAMKAGAFDSVRSCAKHFSVNHSQLGRLLKSGREFTGQGLTSDVLTKEEELMFVKYIEERAKVGYGLTYRDLKDDIQEYLIKRTNEDPQRMCQWPDKRPTDNYIQCFVKRHRLSRLTTMELSKARAQVGADEVAEWQELTFKELVEKYPEIWNDPKRIFNQESVQF